MSRFLGITLFLIIAGGLALHAGLDLPRFFDWFGTLPGDIVIRKEGLVFYIPFASSALISIALSFVLSLFSSKQN